MHVYGITGGGTMLINGLIRNDDDAQTRRAIVDSLASDFARRLGEGLDSGIIVAGLVIIFCLLRSFK